MQPVSNDAVLGKWWIAILAWFLKMLFSYFIVSWTEELCRNWTETGIFYKVILYSGESIIPTTTLLPDHLIKDMFTKIIPVLHLSLLLSDMICWLNLHRTTHVCSWVLAKLSFFLSKWLFDLYSYCFIALIFFSITTFLSCILEWQKAAPTITWPKYSLIVKYFQSSDLPEQATNLIVKAILLMLLLSFVPFS